MNLFKLNLRSTRSRLLLAMLLFLLVGFGYYLSRPTPTPPTLILPLSINIPKNNLPWFDRLIPYSWTWFWRIKPRIFGPPREVVIQTFIFEFTNSPALTDLFHGGIELANTNGIRALGFSPAELKNLRDRLAKPAFCDQCDQYGINPLSFPKMQTADGIAGGLSTTSVIQPVRDIHIDDFPRVYRDAVDLTTTILLTELVSETNSTNTQTKTNLALWTRSRIPDASGLLLLEHHPGSDKTNLLGVLISVNLPSPAKTKTTPKPVQAR